MPKGQPVDAFDRATGTAFKSGRTCFKAQTRSAGPHGQRSRRGYNAPLTGVSDVSGPKAHSTDPLGVGGWVGRGMGKKHCNSHGPTRQTVKRTM